MNFHKTQNSHKTQNFHKTQNSRKTSSKSERMLQKKKMPSAPVRLCVLWIPKKSVPKFRATFSTSCLTPKTRRSSKN